MDSVNVNSRGTCMGCRFCRADWLALWDAAAKEHAVARIAVQIAEPGPLAPFSSRMAAALQIFTVYGERMAALRRRGWELEGPAATGAGL